jgi:hypothetical protein
LLFVMREPEPTKGNTFPCNLQDPRDPLLFPAGTPLSTVMNIATSRTGPGGPIALFYVFEIGSVVSLGYNQNGERDIVTYLQHVRPVYFIPNHVTAVAVEGSSLEWKVRFYDALKARNVPQSSWPQILWIVDPNDYLRPIVFDLDHPDPHF